MKKHTVRKGETLSEIAKSYGVSDKSLREANPKVIKANKIYAGDKLRIPIEPGFLKRLTKLIVD